jgi:hypothetical protein
MFEVGFTEENFSCSSMYEECLGPISPPAIAYTDSRTGTQYCEKCGPEMALIGGASVKYSDEACRHLSMMWQYKIMRAMTTRSVAE